MELHRPPASEKIVAVIFAGPLNGLASLLLDQGDLAGARPLFERALTIFEKVLGREHPSTNRARCNFARMLLAEGNVEQAAIFSEAALAVHEKAFGKDHRWTKESARVTADVFDAQSRVAEAHELAEMRRPEKWEP
jgi:tetratricopeptide (TPR) repeat protein